MGTPKVPKASMEQRAAAQPHASHATAAAPFTAASIDRAIKVEMRYTDGGGRLVSHSGINR
jgi:hypothetical protein